METLVLFSLFLGWLLGVLSAFLVWLFPRLKAAL